MGMPTLSTHTCACAKAHTHKEFPQGGRYVTRNIPLCKLSLEAKSALFCLNNEVQGAEKINAIHIPNVSCVRNIFNEND
jgi:hypothetical protein